MTVSETDKKTIESIDAAVEHHKVVIAKYQSLRDFLAGEKAQA